MKRLAQAMEGALSTGLGPHQQTILGLARQWEDMVGVDLASRTAPVSLNKKGVLVVKTHSSSAAQDLAMQRSTLLNKLAPFGVTQLRTKVATRTPAWRDPMPEVLHLGEAPPKVMAKALGEAYERRRQREAQLQAQKPVTATALDQDYEEKGGDVAKRLAAAYEAAKKKDLKSET